MFVCVFHESNGARIRGIPRRGTVSSSGDLVAFAVVAVAARDGSLLQLLLLSLLKLSLWLRSLSRENWLDVVVVALVVVAVVAAIVPFLVVQIGVPAGLICRPCSWWFAGRRLLSLAGCSLFIEFIVDVAALSAWCHVSHTGNANRGPHWGLVCVA